jgi:hypothetical protein
VRPQAGLVIEGETATATVAAVVIATAKVDGAQEALDSLGAVALELG